MRIGVIGVGGIGVMHTRILSGIDGVEQVMVAGRDPLKTRRVARQLGVVAAADADELIAGCDAVVIATPAATHAELIMAAAAAGLPTFCEKPVSLDIDEARQVSRHVATIGTAVQIGFQRRFDAGYRRARDLVVGGGLGTLYLVRTAGHDPEPSPERFIATSGGIYRDFAVHDFDVLRYVTGDEIDEVYADGSVRQFEAFAAHDDVDAAVATLRLASGALGILDVTRHDPHGYDIRMELFGSGDSVVVGWDDRTPMRAVEPNGRGVPDDPYPDYQDRFRAAFEEQLATFVAVARGDQPSPCSVDDAVTALRVAIACDRSRTEHRPVRVDEI